MKHYFNVFRKNKLLATIHSKNYTGWKWQVDDNEKVGYRPRFSCCC